MKKLFSKLFSNIFVVLGVMAVTPIIAFVGFAIYLRVTGGDPSSPAHPLYADYVNVLYNYKCGIAHPEIYNPYKNETIPASKFDNELVYFVLLKIRDDLHMSYAEALEVLKNAREEWYVWSSDNFQPINTWQHCQQETIDYYNLIIPAVEEKAKKEKIWRDRWKVWEVFFPIWDEIQYTWRKMRQE